MLGSLFADGGYLPRGFCLAWNQSLVYLHFFSDIAIAAAYFSIPAGLALLLYRRPDFPYRAVAHGFMVFILFCGLTHLFAAATLWLPYYAGEAVMKAATALVSIATATALWPIIPRAAALPSPRSQEEKTRALQREIAEHNATEAELRRVRARLEETVAARTAALRESEARLRAMIDAAASAVVVINGKGEIQTFNRAAERTFGRPADEVVGQNVRLLMPAPYAEQHDSYLRHYQETGESRVIGTIRELTALHSDGSTFPIELSVAEAIRDEAYVGIITDITARKEAEAEILRRDRELTAQTALLRSILNSIQHGIAVYGADLKLAAWNPRYEAMYPQPPELLRVGTPLEDQLRYFVAHGLMQEGLEETAIDRLLRRYRSPDLLIQQTPTLTDGRTLDMLISRLPDGRVLHTFTDVTEARASEQQLQDRAAELARSNRELEQFAYVASHDLQEPLRTVGSYCELLRRRYQGRLDTDGDKFIGYIVAGAARMQALIAELLRLSRTGSTQLAIQPVDCRQVVAEVMTDLGAGIAEAGASVEVGELPTLLADRGMLRQLFQNLLGNALKFRSQATPQIRVAAEPAGRGWRFTVSDNGIGIEPRFAERVFVIFQRLHTREEYPGTGIGLAICKKIVERHGGQIWIDTDYRGGARFVFTIARWSEATRAGGCPVM
jgi:PAS domain S-box-containing protein